MIHHVIIQTITITTEVGDLVNVAVSVVTVVTVVAAEFAGISSAVVACVNPAGKYTRNGGRAINQSIHAFPRSTGDRRCCVVSVM